MTTRKKNNDARANENEATMKEGSGEKDIYIYIHTQNCETVSRARLAFDEIESRKGGRSGSVDLPVALVSIAVNSAALKLQIHLQI